MFGWSQQKLADLTGLSRATIINYEGGGVIPKTKSKIFDNIFKSDNVSLSEPEQLYNTNGNRFVEKDDGSFNLRVKLVPFDAYASYVESLEDVSSVYEWDEVTFNVEKYGRGNYMGFRTRNDSMNGGMIDDTPSKTLVLARELGRQHWLGGFNTSQYGWIVICKKSIMHKDITSLNKYTGTITCHSRNNSPEYSDFELELNDVYQIFKVIKRTF